MLRIAVGEGAHRIGRLPLLTPELAAGGGLVLVHEMPKARGDAGTRRCRRGAVTGRQPGGSRAAGEDGGGQRLGRGRAAGVERACRGAYTHVRLLHRATVTKGSSWSEGGDAETPVGSNPAGVSHLLTGASAAAATGATRCHPRPTVPRPRRSAVLASRWPARRRADREPTHPTRRPRRGRRGAPGSRGGTHRGPRGAR